MPPELYIAVIVWAFYVSWVRQLDGLPLVREVPEDLAGKRLDVALAQMLGQFSRRQLQDWIRTGRVLVEGETARPRDPVQGCERIEVWPQAPASSRCEPQDLPLAVVYADEDLIILNKAAGQVMHPAPGHPDGTIQNALLHHFPATAKVPRAGIVHRLDRDTTGLVAVAHNPESCTALSRQLQTREIRRRYQALVQGDLVAGGTIEEPIGRHPRQRQRMCVRAGGREAITHYRVRRKFSGLTLLDIQLETGRTHQIRVHLAHLGYPVVGDPVYGGRARSPAGASASVRDAVREFERQALHACSLQLRHPSHGTLYDWEADLPEDFRGLLVELEESRD